MFNKHKQSKNKKDNQTCLFKVGQSKPPKPIPANEKKSTYEAIKENVAHEMTNVTYRK